MLFSVIIPLYNKAEYIRQTVETVLRQSFSDFEVIIVNDGSTDNSVEVVNSIKDNRINLYSKENEGVSIARNYGISLSKGEYITFLDADDEWHEDFLKNMHDLIQHYPKNAFYTTATILNREGKHQIITHKKQKGESFEIEDYCWDRTFTRINLCAVGSVCIKKELLDGVGGFPVGVKYGEDLDLWLRLACITKLVYSNKPYFTYNITTLNNTATNYRDKNFVFPYWKWYDYKYSKKLSLYLFATRQILGEMKDALSAKKFSDFWFYLKKIRLF
ncbi:MAG: glycosyltransferase family 2 protein [Bacteroidales bacterium]|nr:glycosyltransferase family 2 protein [Bacteroidales bacterium]